MENNHFSSSSSSSQGVNDDNTIQRHEVASRCIEFEAIPLVSSTLGKVMGESLLKFIQGRKGRPK